MAKSRSYGSLFTTLIVLAVAAGGGYYYWRSHQDKGPDFYTTKVSRGEVIQTVTATGTIKPFQDVLVSSQISGYITSLGVDFNSKVKKGDLLATLLPTAYVAAVQSARGDLANSRANAQLQAVNLKRDKDLLQKNLISQSDYDTQEALTEEADAQVQIKSATLLTAQTNLDCRITSPIDGMVMSRAVDVGNSVAATLNSPTLFEIANDLTKMQIDAAVSEADIGNVANGQAVNFTVDAYPSRTFTGTVYQIRSAPSTQQSVVIYDVMISVENPELKLRPGMTANAGIVIARHANVLKVPNSALRFRMPESLAVAAPSPAPLPTPVAAAAPAAAKPAKPGKPLTPTQNRAGVRQILQEVSYVAGTPPTPEMMAKMKELAAERGIELPDRLLSGGGHNNFAGSAEAPVTRTVYLLPSDLPGAKATVARVRLGITDGTDTEVLGGLKEGDTVIVGLNDVMPTPGTHSPFGGKQRF